MNGRAGQGDGLLARAKARIRRQGSSRHSTVWWWVLDNFAEVDEALSRREVTYSVLAAEMAADGLTTRTGRAATRQEVRAAVISVRREIERVKPVARREKPPEPERAAAVPGVRMLPQEPPAPQAGGEETDAIAKVRERMAGARPWVSGKAGNRAG